MRSVISFIPIATTLVALGFAATLFRRYARRGPGAHLLWWGFGMITFAAGTLTESATTLFGWHEPIFRAWYIAGALLGGAPLAQGTVFLLLPERTARRLAVLLVAVILAASLAVLLTPLDYRLVQPYRLSGTVIRWHWVRMLSPFINLYAVSFLIGGAVYSAIRYYRRVGARHRFIGNLCIAVGALLPGVGGAFTRFGHTEVLYVTEFIGLLLIYLGYRFNIAYSPTAGPSQHTAQPSLVVASDRERIASAS